MEDKANDYIQRLAEDVNRLVDDLGTFGCMDDKEPKKTPEDRIREVYQWLTNSKGCGEASEYFKELLEILDKSDTEYERISDICGRIHKVQKMEPWKETIPIRKNTGNYR